MTDEKRDLIVAMAKAMYLALSIDSEEWEQTKAKEQNAVNEAAKALETLVATIDV